MCLGSRYPRLGNFLFFLGGFSRAILVLRAMCLSLALSPHSLLSGGDCSFVGCRHYGHASSAVPPIHYCAAGFKNPIHKKRGRSPPDLI